MDIITVLTIVKLVALGLAVFLLFDFQRNIRELYEHWGTSICNRAHCRRGCEFRRIAKRIERDKDA